MNKYPEVSEYIWIFLYLRATSFIIFTSLPSPLQSNNLKQWEEELEKDQRTVLPTGRSFGSHTQAACTQKGNFTLGAGILQPLTDIPSPIPMAVCCPWADLQPVTNLGFSLHFTSLICQEWRLKTDEKQTQKGIFFFTCYTIEFNQEWDILWTFI